MDALSYTLELESVGMSESGEDTNAMTLDYWRSIADALVSVTRDNRRRTWANIGGWSGNELTYCLLSLECKISEVECLSSEFPNGLMNYMFGTSILTPVDVFKTIVDPDTVSAWLKHADVVLDSGFEEIDRILRDKAGFMQLFRLADHLTNRI